MSNTIQVRRGANANLPALSAGEIGFSTDTKQLHIGDGAANHEIAMLSNVLMNIVEDTTPQLGGVLDSNAHQIGWSKGADVASANALTLGTDGNYFDITGTTAITSIGTLGIGTVVLLHFDGILTLTHNATDLILPSGANITTAAGDEGMFVEYASGDWRCISYTRADGTALVGGGGGLANVVEDTTPQLGGTLDCNSHQIGWSKGSDVASASALTLGTDGNYFDVTGTTTVTSIGTLGIGTVVMLHFDGILILTYHATDLILPTGVNITTAAGDEAMFVEYASGDWRCISYTRADGTALAGGSTATARASTWLGAEGAYLPVTNPAALTEVLGSGTYAGWSYLAFDDTTSEHAIWRVPMPDYDGGNIVVTAFSKPATTPSGAVTLQFNILTIGLANSEAFDSAVTSDTGVNISQAMNTTELSTDVMKASATINPANVAEDDLMVIELSRDVGDDLVGDGRLLGVLVEYTRS